MMRFDVVRRVLEGQSGVSTENNIAQKARMTVRSRKKEKLDELSGFYCRPGNYRLNGARALRGGVNFTITSVGATSCDLLLFKRKQSMPYAIIKIPESYRVGSVYSIFVSGLDCEEFEYATAKGRIAELIIDKYSYELKDMKIILELDTHLSFPAILRENGRLFVYPESWNSGSLCLYEYKGRGLELEFVKMICDESMADAIITEQFGDKMLISTKENDRLRFYKYDNNKHGFVFSQEMEFDQVTARNAGDFFDYNGKTYRPAQVCKKRYGEATEIQEVIKEEKGYKFIPYKRLYSPHPKYNIGLHTINSYKSNTVIDVHGWNNPTVVKSIIMAKNLLGGKAWGKKKHK